MYIQRSGPGLTERRSYQSSRAKEPKIAGRSCGRPGRPAPPVEVALRMILVSHCTAHCFLFFPYATPPHSPRRPEMDSNRRSKQIHVKWHSNTSVTFAHTSWQETPSWETHKKIKHRPVFLCGCVAHKRPKTKETSPTPLPDLSQDP